MFKVSRQLSRAIFNEFVNMMQPGCPSATRALACECERAFVRARDQERTRACADIKAGVEAQDNL